MKLLHTITITLLSAATLVGCGKINQSQDELLMEQAMAALEKSPSVQGMSYESHNAEVAKLLGQAYPNEQSLVLTPSGSSAARGVSGTRPNGVQFSREYGQYVAPSGDSVFAGRARRYNPNNGNTANAGGLWIPGYGVAGYAVAYSPTQGWAIAIGGASYNGGAGMVCTTAQGCVKGGY